MRFLFYTQYYPPEIGAPQTRLRAVAQELVRLGHEVTVLTGMPNYPQGRIADDYRGRFFFQEDIDGIPIYRCFLIPVKSANFLRLLNYFSFQIFSLIPYLILCLRRKPDYVFLESPPIFLTINCLISKLLFGQRWIMNIADLWPESASQLGILREDSFFYRAASVLVRFAYRNADVVTVVQPGHRQHIAECRDDSIILCLPNGAYPYSENERVLADGEDLPSSLRDIFSRKKVVLYAGNHGKAHGLDIVIDISQRLTASQQDDVHILLVGDGSDKDSLIRQATDLKLLNLTFHESVPLDMNHKLLRHSTLALCIANHPDSNVRSAKVFSAMACGVPVLYIGSDDTARLVKESGAGYVVERSNLDEIVSTVEEMTKSGEIQRRCGDRGRSLIVKEYSWEKLVSSWVRGLS